VTVSSTVFQSAAILLVDDDPALLRTMQRLFERFGAQVEAVESGARALERASNRDFDVIITDMRMPGMTGYQLLKELARTLPRLPAVYILSGYHDVPETELLAAGATALLRKPIPFAELCDQIERALSKAQST